jgi:hypothetical protein
MVRALPSRSGCDSLPVPTKRQPGAFVGIVRGEAETLKRFFSAIKERENPCVVGEPSTRSMIPLVSLLARVYIPTTFGLSDAVVVVKLESLSRFPQTLG